MKIVTKCIEEQRIRFFSDKITRFITGSLQKRKKNEGLEIAMKNKWWERI